MVRIPYWLDGETVSISEEVNNRRQVVNGCGAIMRPAGRLILCADLAHAQTVWDS